MTDNEIIKALEFCPEQNCDVECPLFDTPYCVNVLMKNALDLIQRQQKRFDKILSYIDRVEHSGLGKKKALEYIRKFIVKGVQNEDI